MHRSLRRRATGLLLAAGATATATIGVVGVQPASALPIPTGVALVAHDTLFVLTSLRSDTVVLRLAPGSPDTLQVDFGGDGTADARADRRRFTRITVLLGSGNDTFRVDQANGAFAEETLRVHGQNGNDTMTGGDMVERFFGGDGNDFADGNRGVDLAILGNGADVFRWDPGDGSDVIEGEGGLDTLDFRGAAGAENMRLTANGTRSRFFRDAGNITMDMGGVEQLDLQSFGGQDLIEVADMTGTGFQRVAIDLAGADEALDAVSVRGTARPDAVALTAQADRVLVRGLQTAVEVINSELTDRLVVETVGGDDTVQVGDGVTDRITPVVDLGADEP